MTLARVMRERGDELSALALLEQADRWYRTAGGDGALLTRCLLARLTASHDAGLATRRLVTVLDEARSVGDGEATLTALDALALLTARTGDLDHAARTLDEADELHTGLRHLVTDGDRLDARQARELLESEMPAQP